MSILKYCCLASLLCAFTLGVQAQDFVGFSSMWRDKYDEWKMYYVVDSVEYEGETSLTYALDKTYDDWSYRLEDWSGRFYRSQVSYKPTYTLSGDRHSIEVSPIWPRDRNEWRIASGEDVYTLKTRYHGIGDYWILYNKGRTLMLLYTYRKGDVLEWVIEDYAPKVHAEVKIATIQTIILNTITSL